MSRHGQPPLKGYRRYAWLVALAAAVGVYCLVRFGAPVWLDDANARPPGTRFSGLAWLFALPFALLTIVALGRVVLDRRSFKRQVRKASLKDLSWYQFERLIGEMYRRQGFSVVETPRRTGGGFDYLLARGPERWLVQCKHWQARKVGVSTVKQLAGAVASRGACGGIVVTTGRFTPPAQAFAATSGIRLVDGERLSEELLAFSAEPGLEHLHPRHREEAGGDGPPVCPACGGDMIKRTAHKGSHAGQAFWGCARHPDCDGLVPVENASPHAAREGRA